MSEKKRFWLLLVILVLSVSLLIFINVHLGQSRQQQYRTIKNDPADRSDEGQNELEKRLRSVWQGRQFWNGTFGEDAWDFETTEIREILD